MDTSPLGEHSTVPYYAQVDVFDPTVTGAIPTWTDESLDRGIAAGPSGMAIATRSDFERGGDDFASVRMRVWVGAPEQSRVMQSTKVRSGSAGRASWSARWLETTFIM
jgi:hypothetical protein